MPKTLTVLIATNCGKFLKMWEYQTTWPASGEICMQVMKQQLEMDMEQWSGSKLRNKYVKTAYVHPVHFTYMQSTSCKMPGWRKHKLESRLLGEVKVSASNAGDPGSIPGLGRTPGEGNGNPLRYSCLENPMDWGAWWAAVHGVTKSRTRLSDFTYLLTSDMQMIPPLWQKVKKS